jgi:SHS2 domain-containing protein
MVESHYKFVQIDHLSDIGIKAFGNNLKELFESAAAGMFSIMCNPDKVSQLIKKNVLVNLVDNADLGDLLILWLEKLIYVFEVEKMLFSRFEITKILNQANEKKIEAEIYGENIDFKRHEIIVAIKAPTYHMLKVERNKEGDWIAEIIFDV